jgi:CxxC motif-containing protein
MLLVRGAVLTPRLLARTLDLQIRVNSTRSTSRKTEEPVPRTFRRLQLTHAFETLGPRLAPVRRDDVISVDSLTSGRELMLLVDVLFVD